MEHFEYHGMRKAKAVPVGLDDERWLSLFT